MLTKLVILTRTCRYFWPVLTSRRVWPVQPVRGCVNLLRTGQDLQPVNMSRRVRPVQPVTHWQAYFLPSFVSCLETKIHRTSLSLFLCQHRTDRHFTKSSGFLLLATFIVELIILENRLSTLPIAFEDSAKLETISKFFGWRKIFLQIQLTLESLSNTESTAKDHTGRRKFFTTSTPHCPLKLWWVTRIDLWVESTGISSKTNSRFVMQETIRKTMA